MLLFQQTLDIQAEMRVSNDDKTSGSDSDLMNHARNLMHIIRTAEEELNVLRAVLVERRDYIDGVVWQINELGQKFPALVVAQ